LHIDLFDHAKEEYMSKLEGKIALVTGGNSGIGLATAKRFVREGAYVFITGTQERGIGRSREGDRKKCHRRAGRRVEPRRPRSPLRQIKREKGKLDIVFANAGVARYAALGADQRGVLRFDFRHQRKRPAFYGSEGASAPAGRRLDHPECVHRRQQRACGE
jgi:NAD(P)-dependent dehydrogenase (short-subunit alcohol dehydrogenase family)